MLNSPEFGRKGSYTIPQGIALDSLPGQNAGGTVDAGSSQSHLDEEQQHNVTVDPLASGSDVRIRGDRKAMKKIVICAVVLAVVLFAAVIIFVMASSSSEQENSATTPLPSDKVTPESVNRPPWVQPTSPTPVEATTPATTDDDGSGDGAPVTPSTTSVADDYADGSGASLLSAASLMLIDTDGVDINVSNVGIDGGSGDEAAPVTPPANSATDDHDDGSGVVLSVASLIIIDTDGVDINVTQYSIDPKDIPSEFGDIAW